MKKDPGPILGKKMRAVEPNSCYTVSDLTCPSIITKETEKDLQTLGLFSVTVMNFYSFIGFV